MLNTVKAAGSPDWWLLRLGRKLDSDMSRLIKLKQYDCGDHPLPTGNRKMRETYKRFQEMSRSNYTGLVVEAVAERLQVTGFQTGGNGSKASDSAAWSLWQGNKLDADSAQIHHMALALGRAYAIVGPPPDDTPGVPLITPESPMNVIHESDPARPRKTLAALKTWLDHMEGRQLAVVYTPDNIFYYRAVAASTDGTPWEPSAWEADPERLPAKNPLGEVPVVPFINRRQRARMGMGEMEDVTDIMDRINATSLDRLVIQAMQAYRQRWMKGVDVEDENGNPQRPFDPGADLIWMVPDDKAAFGDFDSTDIGPILSATSADVRDLAAISRTPPHYLLADIANVSGDALTAAESGLASKSRSRATDFGESHEEVVRLAGKYVGESIADDSAVVWDSFERRTLAELADAAVKWQAAGVPFRERMSLLGFTPTEIDRMEAERVADALMASLNNPIGVAPGSPGVSTLPPTEPDLSPAAPAAPASPPPVAK